MKKLIGKFKCWRNKHDWGPKTRHSMYAYEEKCEREGCNKILIDSSTLVYIDDKGKYNKISYSMDNDWRIKKARRKR